jgi:DNA-binding transcriptional ArsR family regulator
MAPLKSKALNAAEAVQQKALLKSAKQASTWLKAIANYQRLQVLCILSTQEISVNELNRKVRLSQSALSQHLAILRQAKVVLTRRDAHHIYYRLTPGLAHSVLSQLHKHFCRATAARPFARKKSYK